MRRPFTGKHMAAILIAGFGIVVTVNFAMAALATSTFGGLVVENSYVASQNFNRWLERAKEVEALGWHVDVARLSDGRVLVMTTGNSPPEVRVTGNALHPLGRAPDRTLGFVPTGPGRYVSSAVLPAGRWLVRLELSDGTRTWRGERALP